MRRGEGRQAEGENGGDEEGTQNASGPILLWYSEAANHMRSLDSNHYELSVRTSLLQDLRYSFRTLGKDAGFTIFAVLIIGLGIGASTTLFSVVNQLLLRPLPFKDPERLAWITNHDRVALSGATTQVGVSAGSAGAQSILFRLGGYFAFYGVGDNVLSGKGEPERLSGVPVSENFFPLLGVRLRLGGCSRMTNANGRAPRWPCSATDCG